MARLAEEVPPALESEATELSQHITNESTVSITDEGYACRFCVEGVEIARQIVATLSRAFAFQTSEPMRNGIRPTQRIFRVEYGAQVTLPELARMLSGIPGVRLTLVPARKDSGRR